jgi:hypothetical protein
MNNNNSRSHPYSGGTTIPLGGVHQSSVDVDVHPIENSLVTWKDPDLQTTT